MAGQFAEKSDRPKSAGGLEGWSIRCSASISRAINFLSTGTFDL